MKLNTLLSVLYADNRADARSMLKTLLGFSGINVICADTSQGIWQIAQENYSTCTCWRVGFPAEVV